LADFKAIKDAARRRVQERLLLAAVCYAGGSVDDAEDVTCRIRRRTIVTGDLPSSGLAFADRVEEKPRLIFIRDQHIPEEHNIYSFGDGEAYRVDTVEEFEGVTISAVCSRLSERSAEDWPGPSI